MYAALADWLTGTTVEPRPYQSRLVAKALEQFIGKGLRSQLIESPTGSGKTIMALLIARGMQQQLGVKIGWVAMRRHLLQQAAAAIVEKNLGVQVEFISMFEKNPPRNLDLLVVDEAQHDAANSMAHLHNLIQPRYILGLSATPFRADKVKLCFDSVLKDAGIQQLIQDGYLSRYHHFTIPNYTPKGVAETFVREPQRWGQSLMFFHTLAQCAEARSLLQAAGVACDVVTGSSDREAQFERFEQGETKVLINCMVLTEGFDYPALQTVFCRPSGKSTTIQMAGRVLRQHPALPFKQIVQCQKTSWPFGRTATAAVSHTWQEDSWRSLTLNPLIHQVNLTALRALAKCEVKLPEYLQRKLGATARPITNWRNEEVA